jgi:hypothetical protein
MLAMEARLVALPTRTEPSIRLAPDRIVIEHLVVADAGLAAWLAEQPMDDHAILVDRAMRIGLMAIQSVGVTLNVDAVRAEFERLAEGQRVMMPSGLPRRSSRRSVELRRRRAACPGRSRRSSATAASSGDRPRAVRSRSQGSARSAASRRCSRPRRGDASRLATLLDPTRAGSPLSSFRAEVAAGFKAPEERLVAFQAGQAARSDERSRSAAKGVDFGGPRRGPPRRDRPRRWRSPGAHLERDRLDPPSKKGDFVLTINRA